jgi:hypothetical protein
VDYLLTILITASMYAVLTLSLNLLVGYTGIPSFAHGAFFGIGAYVVALLMLKLGLPWLAAVLVGVVVTGVLAFRAPASSASGSAAAYPSCCSRWPRSAVPGSSSGGWSTRPGGLRCRRYATTRWWPRRSAATSLGRG